MPYADKRFDLKQYNPPPNELGFLGGLGKRTGNVRAKAHVQRPTPNQMLFHMRTTNRILMSFSEDPIMAHSHTKRQLEKASKPRLTKKDLNMKISKIQIADNVIKVSKGKGNSTTSGTEQAKPKATVLTEAPVAGVAKVKPRGFSLGTMKKISIVSTLKSSVPAKPKEEEQSFRAWAIAEREKRHQALQQVSYQQIKQEREANEIFPKPKRAPRVKRSRGKPDDMLPGAQHLGGYLYGGFTEDRGPDKTMDNQTKFNIPLSMFSREQIE